MITTRLYLDCRRNKPGLVAPLKVVLTKKGVRSLIAIGIKVLPLQWVAIRQIVINHHPKMLGAMPMATTFVLVASMAATSMP